MTQIPTVLFHLGTPCPHRPSVEPSVVSPPVKSFRSWKSHVPQSFLFLLTFNEGMSDAASWRAQENSEWNQAASAVHKLWISLISGKTECVFHLSYTVYHSECAPMPWDDHVHFTNTPHLNIKLVCVKGPSITKYSFIYFRGLGSVSGSSCLIRTGFYKKQTNK